MNILSQRIIDEFQIRKSKKQKTAFLDFMLEELSRKGITAKVEKGSFGVRNLVVGDVKNARVVFGAHYDTCAVMLVPNFITPKNIFIYILYQLLVTLILFGVAAAVAMAVWTLTGEFFFGYFAWLVSLFGLCVLLVAGPANKHTMNDNTSGVLALVELLSALPKSELDKAAFVFFDLEEAGLIGSSAFASKHKVEMKQKLLVNLDCVGEGDNILLVRSKTLLKDEAMCGEIADSFAEGDYTLLFEKPSTAFYPSDQANFKKTLAVAALKHGKVGYYMHKIHTPRDTVCDARNLDYLTISLARLVSLI